MSGALPEASWASAAGEPAATSLSTASGPEVPELGQKDRIKFRASEALTQDEFALDGLAFHFFHCSLIEHPTRIDSNSRKARRGSLLPLPVWEKHQSVWTGLRRNDRG